MYPASPAMKTQTNTDRLVDADSSSDERTYALLLHLSLLAHLVTGGLGVLVPVVMWLIKKGDSPFIDDHGREAINFQISLILYTLMTGVLAIITCGVAAILIIGVYVLAIVGMIMAAGAANRGEYFRYPATIRLIH